MPEPWFFENNGRFIEVHFCYERFHERMNDALFSFHKKMVDCTAALASLGELRRHACFTELTEVDVEALFQNVVTR